jgi:hypothetical protein
MPNLCEVRYYPSNPLSSPYVYFQNLQLIPGKIDVDVRFCAPLEDESGRTKFVATLTTVVRKVTRELEVGG